MIRLKRVIAKSDSSFFLDKNFYILTANLRFCYNEVETIENNRKVLYTKIVKVYILN